MHFDLNDCGPRSGPFWEREFIWNAGFIERLNYPLGVVVLALEHANRLGSAKRPTGWVASETDHDVSVAASSRSAR